MKTKYKRFLATLLALSIFISTLATGAVAADYAGTAKDTTFYLCTMSEKLSYVRITSSTQNSDPKPGSVAPETQIYQPNGGILASDFDTLYKMFSDPVNNITNKNIRQWYEVGATDTTASPAITNKTSLAMMMTNLSGTTANVTATKKIVVTGRSARIGTSNINETVTLNVLEGMSVSGEGNDGGYLLIRNAPWTAKKGSKLNQKLVVVLSQPIEVNAGGHLYLDVGDSIAGTGPATDQGRPPVQDELIAPSGQSAIVVKNGGEVHIGAFLIGRAENDTTEIPLIAVETGGKLVMEQSSSTNRRYDEHGMPVYDYSADELPHAAKWNTTITNGSSSTEPAITVANGATLTLNGGTVTSESAGVPAVKVEAGGTVEIPTGTNAAVTAAAGEGEAVAQAIDLAEGAVVRKGVNGDMTELVVTVSEDNAENGDNYVDNYGNIILASGASRVGTSTPMNAAVILADGTLVEGSETEAPTVTYSVAGNTVVTSVAVPAGGSVTDANNKTVTWSNGGTVAEGSNNETVLTPKVGVELDKTMLVLHQDETGTLNTTMVPDGTKGELVWISSDDEVATVDETGKVTAIGGGTATITVKATVKTEDANDAITVKATCEVVVTGHTWKNWTSDEEGHWHECTMCDAELDKAEHEPGDDPTEDMAQLCKICGYEIAPPLNHTHDWGEGPVWDWSDDYSFATAAFTCESNEQHTKLVKATVTTERTEPTEEAEGKIVYTATVVLDGEEYTNTKEVILEKLEPSVQPSPSGDSGSDAEAFIGAAVVIGGGAAALAYYYREALPVWKLAGVVTLAADTADAAAAPVANATVALLRDGETVKTLTTDANGMFTARLPKGEYEAVVTWEKDGVAYAARGTVTAESVLKDGAVQEIVLTSEPNE